MDSFKVGQLSISSNAVTTFETWSKWKRSLAYFIDSKAIKDSLQKKAILLHKGGPVLQEIFASLEKVHEKEAVQAKDQYAFALNILDKHFKPTVNRSYERYLFRLIRQNDESIEQFVIRLRHQAENCEFSDANQEITDQIIFGTSNSEFRTKILERRLESLDEIVDLGKLLESVSLQSNQFAEGVSSSVPSSSSASVDSVARVSSAPGKTKNGTPFYGKRCKACGSRRHDSEASDCPVKEGNCYKCEKKGHFANCCPERRRKPFVGKAETSSKPLGRLKSEETNKSDSIKLVKPAPTEESSEDSDDFSFAIVNRDMSLPQQLEENRVSVRVGGIKIKVYVDSMSSRVLFDSFTWNKLRKNGVQFRKAEVTRNLFPYGKSQPLSVKEAVYVEIVSSFASAWTKAYILAESEGCCESILSSRVAKDLGILRVGNGVSNGGNGDDVIRRIASGFNVAQKKTGKLKNFQLHIPQDKLIPPVAQGCRRIPFALRKPLREKTNSLLNEDIIERVHGATPWVSNIVPVIKKNGDLRICVDMRRANQAVLRERYPIPTFDEIVSDLRDCEFFSKIDLHSAYHQVELAPESRSITTFVTPDCLFRFKRLFFGIKCAPEMFQRIMQDLLCDLPNVRVFFDDIIIFSKTRNDHEKHVRQVLEKLRSNGLTINPDKSIFGVRRIEFLGHKISKNTVEPSEANIAAVKNFSVPQCKKDLQSFLGLINFVSRFIPHYSSITAPLRLLLRKNAVFKWSEEHMKAFELLKDSVANMRAAIFDPSAEIMLLTDASPVGLGAVLLQRSSAVKIPEIIAFASHSLTPAERNYSQIEREALGIVWGCEKFRIYLLGWKFELLTDHKPLETLFGPKSKPNARLERWIIRLQCFDYKIRHIAGDLNIADPFSCLLQPLPGTRSCSKGVNHTVYKITEMAVPKKFDLVTIRNESLKDGEIRSVLEALKSSVPVPSAYLRIRYELTECDGILLRGDKIIPPSSLRPGILRQAHEGHPGVEVMKRRLRSKVWWPKIDSEVDNFVKKCFSCLVVSKAVAPPPMCRTALPAEVWEYLAIDYLGPLPSGEYIFVVIDYFSRFLEIAFTRSTSATETIRLLWIIFARHGFPIRLKSDNAQAFRSKEFVEFLAEYGVEHITLPPLWSQANGEVERQNRSLLKRLKIAASEEKNLEIESYKFLLLYNSTPHSTTGVAPAQLLFQRQLRDKIPSISHPSIQRDQIVDRDAENKFIGKQKADARVRAKLSTIQPGDSVVLRARPSNKLSPNFEPEPFKVLDISDKEVTIQRGSQRLRRSLADVKQCPPILEVEQSKVAAAVPKTYAQVAASSIREVSPVPGESPPSLSCVQSHQQSPEIF